MGTADMHGGKVEASEGGIKFTDNQGNPVAFETCRLGTIKELETVKAALENRERAHNLSLRENSALRAEAAKSAEKLATADAAYKAEKEKSAAAQQVIVDRDVRISQFCEQQGKDSLKVKDAERALTSARAELEDLMPVKAQLEETNTALEVARKELTEATEALADATKANEGYRDALAARGKDIGEVTSALETSERQLGESQATMGALVPRMRAFCDGSLNALESEKTSIDVMVAFLDKLSGE